MTSVATGRGPRRAPTAGRAWPGALLVASLTLLAYGPALRAGYIWDDDRYVTANPTLVAPHGLRAIWTDGFATPQYYPLVHTSYWVEHRLWGLDPVGYHLDNVLLHLAGAWLLFRVLTLLGVDGAGFAAALFALHPVHVESVAWVTERKNVLSGVFYFGAALAYLKASARVAPSMVPADRRWYYASLALFGCALLSKSVTVGLPAAIAIVVLWKRGRDGARELGPLVPLLAIGAVMASVTAWLEKHHVGAAGHDWGFGVLDRTVIAGRALWFYASKLVWPHPLVFVYPRWDVAFDHGLNPLWPASVLALALGVFALRRRIGSGPLAVAASYAVTLAPALGFVDFYPMRFSFVADHFQYHASAAPLAALGWVGAWLMSRAPSRVPSGRSRATRALLGSVLALLGLTTWTQSQVYRDEATVWRDTLEKNPAAWLASLNLGRLEAQAGSLGAAERHLADAVRLAPDEARAHVNLGALRLLQGRADEAVAELRVAVRLEPKLADAHLNLGLAYERRGERDEAARSYRSVLVIEPANAAARARLRELESP